MEAKTLDALEGGAEVRAAGKALGSERPYLLNP